MIIIHGTAPVVSKLVMVGAVTRLWLGNVLSIDVDGFGAADGDFSNDVSSGDVACFVFESSIISISSILIGCGDELAIVCCISGDIFGRHDVSNSILRCSRSCKSRNDVKISGGYRENR